MKSPKWSSFVKHACMLFSRSPSGVFKSNDRYIASLLLLISGRWFTFAWPMLFSSLKRLKWTWLENPNSTSSILRILFSVISYLESPYYLIEFKLVYFYFLVQNKPSNFLKIVEEVRWAVFSWDSLFFRWDSLTLQRVLLQHKNTVRDSQLV